MFLIYMVWHYHTGTYSSLITMCVLSVFGAIKSLYYRASNHIIIFHISPRLRYKYIDIRYIHKQWKIDNVDRYLSTLLSSIN